MGKAINKYSVSQVKDIINEKLFARNTELATESVKFKQTSLLTLRMKLYYAVSSFLTFSSKEIKRVIPVLASGLKYTLLYFSYHTYKISECIMLFLID